MPGLLRAGNRGLELVQTPGERQFLQTVGRTSASVALVPTVAGLATLSLARPVRSTQSRGQRGQPDGWGSVGRIGILLPAGGAVPESEFAALGPQGVSIHAAPAPLGVRAATQRGRDPAAGSVSRAHVNLPNPQRSTRERNFSRAFRLTPSLTASQAAAILWGLLGTKRSECGSRSRHKAFPS
jgi:hypothetical protein